MLNDQEISNIYHNMLKDNIQSLEDDIILNKLYEKKISCFDATKVFSKIKKISFQEAHDQIHQHSKWKEVSDEHSDIHAKLTKKLEDEYFN